MAVNLKQADSPKSSSLIGPPLLSAAISPSSTPVSPATPFICNCCGNRFSDRKNRMNLCEVHRRKYFALHRRKTSATQKIESFGKITRKKKEEYSRLQKKLTDIEIQLKPFSQAYIQRNLLAGLPGDILNKIVSDYLNPMDTVSTYGASKSLKASLHNLREQKVRETLAKKNQQLMEIKEAKDLEERRQAEESRRAELAAEAEFGVYSILMCTEDTDGTMKYEIRFWDEENGRPDSLENSRWIPADECPADLLQRFITNGRTETVNPDYE
jgi:hypothetical protein